MEFFFEIYTEEVPSRMQPAAQKLLKDLLLKKLEVVEFKEVETFITPQRLVGYVKQVSALTKEVCTKIRGPKVGITDEILNKFLSSKGIEKKDLYEEGGYYFFDEKIEAKPFETIIPQLIKEIFEEFHWPKTMCWPESEVKWVRPIRSVYVVLNGKILSFDLPFLGLVTSSFIYGHRFLNPGTFSPVTFNEYQDGLHKKHVVLSHAERKKIILKALQSESRKLQVELVLDEELLVDTAGLCEYPKVYIGNIESKFMVLPKEVLITSMKSHQKYFSFMQKGGSLAPHFGVVSNMNMTDETLMMKGYERVLRARLSDAEFFYETDLKVPLSSYDLSKVLFHKKLGTINDKVKRLLSLASTDEQKTVIQVCKSDLMTHMVYEFPELQGVMGYQYASKQGMVKETAKAIEEHYKPLGAHDSIPGSRLGCIVSVLDKLDSLIGLIGVGVKISGSKDPYGFRRMALGIIRIYEKVEDLESLETLMHKIYVCYESQGYKLADDAVQKVYDFIISRFTVYMQDKGINEKLVQACVAEVEFKNLFDKLNQLTYFIENQEGKVFLQVYKRFLGLLNVKVKLTEKINKDYLSHEAEYYFYDILNGSIELHNLSDITIHLTRYFDDVTINDGDLKVVEARQMLLISLKTKIESICNFSILV